MARGASSKNVILGAIAVVIVVVAVYIYVTQSRVQPQYPSQFTTHAVCLETKKEIELTLPIDEQPPYKNPATGRRTVYPWQFCTDCKYRFVAVGKRPTAAATTAPAGTPTTGPFVRTPQGAVLAVCPHCGGTSTQVWAPDDPEMAEPAGDVPLPEALKPT
jgi:hypothetical protein